MSRFHGIIPPMITPLNSDGTLDAVGTEKLVEHILAGGVHGLFLLGTTGEAPDLPYEVRRDFVKRVCAQVAGRVPVLVGITDTVFSESVKMAEIAKDCGATAVVAAPPYYFAAGQPELIDYYTQLADAVPLPLFLYNMPSQVKVMIDVKTVVALAKHPNIIGLKDSSGNIGYFNACRFALRDNPDFAIFIGPEEAMGEVVLMGADGGVNGGANMFPEVYVGMYDAAVRGDIEACRKFQERIMAISTNIYGIGHHNSSLVKGVKCVLHEMGIITSETLAAPRVPFNEADRATVRQRLKELV